MRACAVDRMQLGVDGGGESGGESGGEGAVEDALDSWRHERDDADADDVGSAHLADTLSQVDGVHAVFLCRVGRPGGRRGARRCCSSRAL